MRHLTNLFSHFFYRFFMDFEVVLDMQCDTAFNH